MDSSKQQQRQNNPLDTRYEILNTRYAHIDCDSFFASVLARKDPQLKGKPILALGMGGGFVIAASYEAKAKGVRTGMRLIEARKLCPEAKPIISDFLESCRVSETIEQILESRCARIEKMSVDEWYLDLNSCQGGIPKNPEIWAGEIQEDIRKQIGVTVSIGIAPTKLLAKMAGEYRKPSGITIIIQKPYLILNTKYLILLECFLNDRTSVSIPGIGPRRQLHSDSYGWKTAWDIANAPKDIIKKLFGRPGLDMQKELLGIPVSDVNDNPPPPKSISRCRSFGKEKDRDKIFGCLLQHLSYCVLKMRLQGLGCREVFVWARDEQYKYSGCPHRLPQIMDTEEQILPYIKFCFGKILSEGASYTQIGTALNNLKPMGNAQYSLFESAKKTARADMMQRSLDAIRNKYGRDAIVLGPGLKVEAKKQKRRGSIPDAYGRILDMR